MTVDLSVELAGFVDQLFGEQMEASISDSTNR